MMEHDDGYRIIPPLKQVEENGVKCGQCGLKFDHGQAYGFWCSDPRCPMQAKTTC